MQVFLVGGCVRDHLLGVPNKDRDWVVVGETPASMLARGFVSVGKDFPVFLHPDTGEEHALARQERKSGVGHQGFSFSTDEVTLEQDLLRRDLTINAIAMTMEGSIIDPHGGLRDLEARVLRHVSEAFREDPLRVLRVARFAARFSQFSFTVAPETIALMREMVQAGEINHLTAERVWQEMERALAGPAPRVFFDVLREVGALTVILPELDLLWGVPQRADHHPEVDTGIHTMMVLDQATRLSPVPEVRFAALVHDLGKGTTPPDVLPRHIGHEERSVGLVVQVCDRLRVPTSFRDLAIHVARDHTTVHRALELRPGTILDLFHRTNAWQQTERFRNILVACEADARGRLGFEEREYPQRELLERALEDTREVDVAPLLERGLKGKEIGEAIRQVRAQRLAQR